MSFTDDSSDPEWKTVKVKREKSIRGSLGSSGKPKYYQKFCDKWLDLFHPWLTRCEDDLNKPFCRACQTRLDCNRCHLQRHELTSKHARNLEILINKGEGAARQNLSIRQERSKYYQQRKKMNAQMADQDNSGVGLSTSEDYIEDFGTDRTSVDGETSFQFVQAGTASGDQFNDETVLKQEGVSVDSRLVRSYQKTQRGTAKQAVIKKERMKLLMQIQQDKNELMDSFKELMGANGVQQSSPPKERNHVDLFFDSVSSSVKALSPKLTAEAKMRVSQLICELELRALTETDANGVGAAAAGATVMVSADGSSNAYIINPSVATVVHSEHHQDPEDEEQNYESLS